MHPKANITLDVSLDSTGNVLSGTLSDGLANNVGVNGWRNVWPTRPGNASAFSGLHTFYLRQPNDTDESLPQRSGFGSLLVSANSGVSIITASLSDGTKMSGATFVGPNGEGFLYGSLYTNLGSVVGRLDIDSDNNVTRNPTWMRPDLSAKPALTYRTGFAHIELTVNGGLYVPPNRGALILGLSPGAENAKVVLSGGGLSNNILKFAHRGTAVNGELYVMPRTEGRIFKLFAIRTSLSENRLTVLQFLLSPSRHLPSLAPVKLPAHGNPEKGAGRQHGWGAGEQVRLFLR